MSSNNPGVSCVHCNTVSYDFRGKETVRQSALHTWHTYYFYCAVCDVIFAVCPTCRICDSAFHIEGRQWVCKCRTLGEIVG